MRIAQRKITQKARVTETGYYMNLEDCPSPRLFSDVDQNIPFADANVRVISNSKTPDYGSLGPHLMITLKFQIRA